MLILHKWKLMSRLLCGVLPGRDYLQSVFQQLRDLHQWHCLSFLPQWLFPEHLRHSQRLQQVPAQPHWMRILQFGHYLH
jgi:hypothetical protein